MKETYILQLCKQNEDYTTISLNSITGSVYTASLTHKDNSQIMQDIISIVGDNPIQMEEVLIEAI